MTPREFEQSVAAHFEANGYAVELSPYTGDWGVDVFAARGAERLAIQAKMYGGSTRRVNRECMMQLYGAAAFFDCTGAVLASDGEVMPDAREVADKLGIRILQLQPTPTEAARKNPTRDLRFDDIWERYVMPLTGRTLQRSDGSTNEVVSVDWASLTRTTSGGTRQRIPIEIFRFAIEHVLRQGSITRDEINQHYPGRASSGIVLVLAQVPLFTVGGRPTTVRMRTGG